MADQPIRESTRRWWIDRHGTVWIRKASLRRKPMSEAEQAAIMKAVAEFNARGGEDRVN